MKTKIRYAVMSIILLVLATYTNARAAGTPDELKRAIEEKSKVLSEVVGQIQATQRALNETNVQSKSLNQEVKRFDALAKQLSFGIRASELKIDKLTLEIESLRFNIDAAQEAISSEKEAIGKFLRVVFAQDRQTLLTVLLNSQSLAYSLSGSRALARINDQLTAEVSKLTELRAQLSGRLTDSSAKKTELEIERQTLNIKRAASEDEKNRSPSIACQN